MFAYISCLFFVLCSCYLKALLSLHMVGPNAVWKCELCGLVICLRIEYIAIVVYFERSCRRLAIVVFFVFEVREHDVVFRCRSHFVNLSLKLLCYIRIRCCFPLWFDAHF